MQRTAEKELAPTSLETRARMIDRLMHQPPQCISSAGDISAAILREKAAPIAPKPKKKFDQVLSEFRSRHDHLAAEMERVLKEIQNYGTAGLCDQYRELAIRKQSADAELQQLTEDLLAGRSFKRASVS